MDAADSTTITRSGANVTQWNDKANNYSGPATNNPQYNSSPINGLPTIHFDGASSRYVLISANNYNYSFMTYFMVIRWVSGTGGFMGTDTPSNYGRALAVNSPNVQLLLYSQFYTTNLPLTANQPCILSAYFNGTTDFTVILNGTPTVFAVGQGTGNTNTNGFNIGVFNPSNGGNHSFDMGEGIVYSSILNETQRQSIEGYLAQKWGLVSSLPAGHPGRSQTFYTAGKNPGIAAVPSSTVTKVPYGNYFPLSLAGCQLWLDGADSTTVTGTSPVTAWRDKSGLNYTAINNLGTSSVSAASLNGLNTIYVPSGANLKIANFLFYTNFTTFIVGKAAAANLLIGGLFGTNGIAFYEFTGNGDLLAVPLPSGTTFLDVYDNVGVPISANTWFIWCIGYNNLTNSTASPYRVNGNARTTLAGGGSSIVPSSSGTGSLYLNSTNGANSYDSDYFAEIIHYNTTLTTAQCQGIEGYLAWKWGLQSTNLPISHPYYSVPPLEFDRPTQVASIPLQLRIIPDPWTPLRPLSSGVLPWHWFRGDVGMTTTAWTNFGTSKSNASNVGTITLGNYTQGGTQAGGTNNTCTVSPSGYWRWPGVYQTSYHAIFGVFKVSSLTTGQTWTWKGNSTAGRGYTPQYRITNTSGVFTDDILSQGAFLPLSGTTIDPTTRFYTHSMVWGSTPAVSLLQVGTKIASPNGWTTDYGLGIYDNEYIGFAVAPAQPAGVTMTVCEILLFAANYGYGGPVDLTAQDILDVQSYLARKWGV